MKEATFSNSDSARWGILPSFSSLVWFSQPTAYHGIVEDVSRKTFVFQVKATATVPDGLVDEVVRVLGRKHCESGPCRHTLLKADHLGVDWEDGRLVHVLNRDGDPRRGLEGRLNAAGQVGLVGYHHRQHKGAVHFEIHRLQGNREGRSETRERERERAIGHKIT